MNPWNLLKLECSDLLFLFQASGNYLLRLTSELCFEFFLGKIWTYRRHPARLCKTVSPPCADSLLPARQRSFSSFGERLHLQQRHPGRTQWLRTYLAIHSFQHHDSWNLLFLLLPDHLPDWSFIWIRHCLEQNPSSSPYLVQYSMLDWPSVDSKFDYCAPPPFSYILLHTLRIFPTAICILLSWSCICFWLRNELNQALHTDSSLLRIHLQFWPVVSLLYREAVGYSWSCILIPAIIIAAHRQELTLDSLSQLNSATLSS